MHLQKGENGAARGQPSGRHSNPTGGRFRANGRALRDLFAID
jgi:hypothetical protein